MARVIGLARLHALLAVTWAALLQPAIARAQTPNARQGTLTVSAVIDGISYLHFSPTGIFWQHSGWAAPGLHQPLHLPTKVTLVGPAELALDWCPIWANGCDTCSGTCGELRNEAMLSRPLELPLFPGLLLGVTLECRARETCRLIEAPSAANGYAGVIEMNDSNTPGYEEYTAILHFEYCPEGCGDGGATPPLPDAAPPDAAPARDSSPLPDTAADLAFAPPDAAPPVPDAAPPADAAPTPPDATSVADAILVGGRSPTQATTVAADAAGADPSIAIGKTGCSCALPGTPARGRSPLPAPTLLLLAAFLGHRRRRGRGANPVRPDRPRWLTRILRRCLPSCPAP